MRIIKILVTFFMTRIATVRKAFWHKGKITRIERNPPLVSPYSLLNESHPSYSLSRLGHRPSSFWLRTAVVVFLFFLLRRCTSLHPSPFAKPNDIFPQFTRGKKKDLCFSGRLTSLSSLLPTFNLERREQTQIHLIPPSRPPPPFRTTTTFVRIRIANDRSCPRHSTTTTTTTAS